MSMRSDSSRKPETDAKSQMTRPERLRALFSAPPPQRHKPWCRQIVSPSDAVQNGPHTRAPKTAECAALDAAPTEPQSAAAPAAGTAPGAPTSPVAAVIGGAAADVATGAVSAWRAPSPMGMAPASLFRRQALRIYEEGERLNTALCATTAPTWFTLGCLGSAIIAAVAICSVFSIDILGRGPGILRSPGGVRIIASQVNGRVERVLISAGSEVKAGDVLVAIDDSELRSQLLQTERRLATAEGRLERHRSEDGALYEQNISLLQKDQKLTRRRLLSQQQSMATQVERERALRELSRQGIVSRSDDQEALERLRDVRRTHMELERQLTNAEIAAVSLARERASKYEQLKADRDAAAAARDAAQVLLRQSVITAPQAGRVESVVATPGELLQAGVPIATIVPLEAPTQVIAFVPDRDRAFLRVGARARLEVNQLPSGEFGTLGGRVTRVGSGFASAVEIRSILGESAAIDELSYRVDIELDRDEHTRDLLEKLHAGTLVTARVAVRSRRIITLIFDPLRAYFE
jgi:multidrug resistance efflux pump